MNYQDIFDEEKSVFLDDFFTFLKFRTISSNYPKTSEEMFACVDFIQTYLEGIFSTELWETEEHPPVLFAYNTEAGPDKKTLLLYMHYDVQPIEPLDEWKSEPFDPELRDGYVYSRGASDNKGQCFYTLFACKEFFKKHGKFPINIKIIIDGEEEIGSPGLGKLLEKKEESIRADELFIVDGGFNSEEAPRISLGARGLVNIIVNVTESNSDLHSGSLGGAAYNPNRALIKMLASLHDENNRVCVKGFYDDVIPLSKQEMTLLCMDNQEESCFSAFGFHPSGMEKNYSVYEAIFVRPTLEICGIGGGYTGPGFKTVIPKMATAYLSCRLVPNQVPERIGKAVINHLLKVLPKGLKMTSEIRDGASLGWHNTENISAITQKLSGIYEKLFGAPCKYTLMGGSIPIALDLAASSKARPVICGVSFNQDNIHAPNEKFSLSQLRRGFLSICMLLESEVD